MNDRFQMTESTRRICSRWVPEVCTETQIRKPGEIVSDRICAECQKALELEWFGKEQAA